MDWNDVLLLIFIFIFAWFGAYAGITMALQKKKDNVEVRYIFVSEKEIKKDSLLDLIRKVTETNEHKFL